MPVGLAGLGTARLAAGEPGRVARQDREQEEDRGGQDEQERDHHAHSANDVCGHGACPSTVRMCCVPPTRGGATRRGRSVRVLATTRRSGYCLTDMSPY